MLSSGAHTALSPACLRCQLRSVLQHLRHRRSPQRALRLPHRNFSVQHRRRDEEDIQVLGQQRQEGELVHRHIRLKPDYRHIHPEGRIVGKGKRRQRQLSESLTINSLGETSNVIVLRDLPNELQENLLKANDVAPDELEASGGNGGEKVVVTAEDIEASLGSTPEQKEVNTSIDAMRPEDTITDEKTFNALLHGLVDGYNMHQLSLYRRSRLAAKQAARAAALGYASRPANKSKITTLQMSRWQEGVTPLEKRRFDNVATTTKAQITTARERVADQILRIVWDLTISAEEQAIGEKEIKLAPWQVALLFGLKVRGKTKIESLISSELLLRNSKIQVHRPDCVLRITARRQDAEEIAKKLETKLMTGDKLSIRHKDLRPQSEGPKPKRKQPILLSDEDIAMISDKTQSVLEKHPDGKIIIYGLTSTARHEGRRLLMSLFDVSGRATKTICLEPASKQKKGGPAKLTLPISAAAALHYRDRSKNLTRAVQPTRKSALTDAMLHPETVEFRSTANETALPIVNHFSSKHLQVPESRLGNRSAFASYFGTTNGLTLGKWEAQLGLHVSATPPQSTSSSGPTESVSPTGKAAMTTGEPKMVAHTGSGYETMLSYLNPRHWQHTHNKSDTAEDFPLAEKRIMRTTSIKAHFTPSFNANVQNPKAQKVHLPRIVLDLQRHQRTLANGQKEVSVTLWGLRAIFETHNIDVSLPSHSTDLRFTRKLQLNASHELAAQDENIGEFIAALNRSLKAGGSLVGRDTTFKLPAWSVKSDENKSSNGKAPHKSKEDNAIEEVPYLFERFESQQTVVFRPDRDVINMIQRPSTDYEGKRVFIKFDPAVRQLLTAMDGHVFLIYKEIDGGVMGGQQTRISLHTYASTKPMSTAEVLAAVSESRGDPGKRAPPPNDMKQLLDSALGNSLPDGFSAAVSKREGEVGASEKVLPNPGADPSSLEAIVVKHPSGGSDAADSDPSLAATRPSPASQGPRDLSDLMAPVPKKSVPAGSVAELNALDSTARSLANLELSEAEREVTAQKKLVAAALSVVEVVTRGSRGQLQPLRPKRVSFQDQWDAA